MTITALSPPHHDHGAVESHRHIPTVIRLGLVVLAAGGVSLVCPMIAGGAVARGGVMHTVMVMMLALVIQALPFIVAGGIASGIVAAVMTPARWKKILPSSPVAATLAGVGCGVVVPTCECASVIVARRLMDSGVPRPAAIGFMLAAPSLNPIVLGATAQAFGSWSWALARALAALGAIAIVCVVCVVPYHGDDNGPDVAADTGPATASLGSIAAVACHDSIRAASFLALGGFIAGVASVVVPSEVMQASWDNPLLGVGVSVIGAVVLCLCSYSDSFVAVSLPFSPVAQLVFLTVGPIVDVKLAVLMARFLPEWLAMRIIFSGLVAATVTAAIVGVVVL